MNLLVAGTERRWVVLVAAFALFIAIGTADFLTESSIFISFLFPLPIALIAWGFGLVPGLYFSILCILLSVVADLQDAHGHPVDTVLYWNAGLRAIFFLIFCLMLVYIRKEFFSEYSKARIDPVTNVHNPRAFLEMFEPRNIGRFKVPLTVAFLDLDDFKRINDRFGHDQGNVLLKTVAETLQKTARHSGVIARLGGDEFVMALSGTDLAQARKLMQELRRRLAEAVGKIHLPATVSIGAVVLNTIPSNMLDVIRLADQLMYAVKKKGKNAFKLKVLPKSVE